MKREQLLRAVGDIRDDFIREAAPPAAAYRKRREFPWAGAVAACLALMIVGAWLSASDQPLFKKRSRKVTVPKSLN